MVRWVVTLAFIAPTDVRVKSEGPVPEPL